MLQFFEQRSLELAAGSLFSLLVFAAIVSFADLGLAGRTYAAYGGIYIAAAFAWFIFIDKGTLTVYDLVGVMLSIAGSVLILFGHFR